MQSSPTPWFKIEEIDPVLFFIHLEYSSTQSSVLAKMEKIPKTNSYAITNIIFCEA